VRWQIRHGEDSCRAFVLFLAAARKARRFLSQETGGSEFAEEKLCMDYDLLVAQADALLDGESNFIANAANFSAFVFDAIPELNWAGFYLLAPTGELVVGPFQGKPACARLAPGRGVCGAAVSREQTIIVDDVHDFADHIVCDSASVSEIVVPLRDSQRVYGVFDVDSPRKARFSPEDREGIERLVGVFLARAPFRATAD
jgi:L-methionine (R)-S-oxide reductase